MFYVSVIYTARLRSNALKPPFSVDCNASFFCMTTTHPYTLWGRLHFADREELGYLEIKFSGALDTVLVLELARKWFLTDYSFAPNRYQYCFFLVSPRFFQMVGFRAKMENPASRLANPDCTFSTRCSCGKTGTCEVPCKNSAFGLYQFIQYQMLYIFIEAGVENEVIFLKGAETD